MKEIKSLLIKGAELMGVALTAQAVEDYLFYIDQLKKWNSKINLTSLTGDLEIVAKHFMDSLTAAPYAQGAQRVLDIGAGAGFPGLPLKIISPAMELTLLEASEKKCFFLRHIIRGLKLEGVEVVHGRAEDSTIQGRYADCFDLVLSRAVANLPTSLRLALSYPKKGGVIVGMRGKKGEQEQGETDWEQWGLRLIEMKKLILPFVEETRVLLLFQRSDS